MKKFANKFQGTSADPNDPIGAQLVERRVLFFSPRTGVSPFPKGDDSPGGRLRGSRFAQNRRWPCLAVTGLPSVVLLLFVILVYLFCAVSILFWGFRVFLVFRYRSDNIISVYIFILQFFISKKIIKYFRLL